MGLAAVQVDWSRAKWTQSTGVQLCVAPSRDPVVIQPTTGARYARGALTHDKIHTRPASKRPVPPYHVVCFFFFILFSLSLSVISPCAFSHRASFRLVRLSRGDPVSDALDASGLYDWPGLCLWKNQVNATRVKVPLAWARMKKRATHVLPRQMFMPAWSTIDTSLYSWRSSV